MRHMENVQPLSGGSTNQWLGVNVGGGTKGSYLNGLREPNSGVWGEVVYVELVKGFGGNMGVGGGKGLIGGIVAGRKGNGRGGFARD